MQEVGAGPAQRAPLTGHMVSVPLTWWKRLANIVPRCVSNLILRERNQATGACQPPPIVPPHGLQRSWKSGTVLVAAGHAVSCSTLSQTLWGIKTELETEPSAPALLRGRCQLGRGLEGRCRRRDAQPHALGGLGRHIPPCRMGRGALAAIAAGQHVGGTVCSRVRRPGGMLRGRAAATIPDAGAALRVFAAAAAAAGLAMPWKATH